MPRIMCDPAATYAAAKPLRIDGIDLQPGDLLPDEFTNRSAAMLDKLLRARMIQLVDTPPEPRPAPVKPKPVAADLQALTLRELLLLCKQRKLSPAGNKAALQKRIMEALDAVG